MAKAQVCAADHILDRWPNVHLSSPESEEAMSTMSLDMSLDITTRSRPRLRWSQVKKGLAEWRHRARSRRELMNLDDAVLHDIGVSRCSAGFEASKPFWMA
jgi:uncharacterized protein YjiS (DUF1127 family)